ncbi:hypothetical protein D3C72_1555140 [compost metagenome]
MPTAASKPSLPRSTASCRSRSTSCSTRKTSRRSSRPGEACTIWSTTPRRTRSSRSASWTSPRTKSVARCVATRESPGTRARSSSASMKRSTASSAASPTGAWWPTTTSTTRRPMSSCWGQLPRSLQHLTRRSSPDRRPRCSAWSRGKSLRIRATSQRSRRTSSTHRGTRCETPRTPATLVWQCLDSWPGCLMA